MALPPDAKILSVMVVGEHLYDAVWIGTRLHSWEPEGYRRCEISWCELSQATQDRLGAFFGADGRLERGRRRWTRILIAALPATQQGLLSDRAMTWLGNNPQALVYCYLPNSHIAGPMPNVHSVVMNIGGRERAMCTTASLAHPIMQLAAVTNPRADPRGLRYLVGED
jgi:hypothetical protein